MLKSLIVKDYALIENIEIDFNKGLNIITGETGAGKSILIDALGLLLGERASSESIRKGSAKSYVEGLFDVEGNRKIEKLLSDNDIDFQEEMYIRREISIKGTNRCFINDTPVPLSLIKDAGNLLIDLHGQHEHQSLLQHETHIEYLDELSGVGSLLKEYQGKYSHLLHMLSDMRELKEREKDLKEKKDFYSFQIKEIDAVSPEENEDDKILQEMKILENSEKLLEITSGLFQSLYDGESSVYDKLTEAEKKLSELASIDNTFVEAVKECETSVALIKDISDLLRNYQSGIDDQAERLEGLRERLSALNLLKKKYGGSINAVIAYRDKIGKDYLAAENFEAAILQMENSIGTAREECGRAAEELSAKRKAAAKKVEKDVIKVLDSVGITDAQFIVQVNTESAENNSGNFISFKGKNYKCDSRGFNKVEFFISTNAGEDPKPLIKTASGGEVSRIMLALKSILAKSDKLPILIFDEIDVGISGRIAQKVGKVLKDLADYHQIIAITHLPQIAGMGGTNYAVEKSLEDGRVISTIRKLNESEKVNEIAKLISGEELTEASIEGARLLINSSKN